MIKTLISLLPNKRMSLYLAFLGLIITTCKLDAQVSGTVFNDYNFNGVNNTEQGISGVVVNAYNAGGTLESMTTTLANGTFSFPNLASPAGILAGTAVRLEFVNNYIERCSRSNKDRLCNI